MELLPMAPGSCSLDEGELRAQIARYRTIGDGGAARWLTQRSVGIVIGRHVPDDLINELIVTEQSCCPFFDLDWSPDDRQLRIAVADAQDTPALDVIATALGAKAKT